MVTLSFISFSFDLAYRIATTNCPSEVLIEL